MSIKWSPLKVAEAMDMVEEYVTQAVEPLGQARIVACEAEISQTCLSMLTSIYSGLSVK